MAGQAGALVVTTPLTGTFEALGTLTGAAGSGVSAVGGALGNIIGGNVGQQVENLAGKAFDQHTNIQGTVTTSARPAIASNWRLAPNLSAQVNVVDVVLPIGGLKLSVGNAVKPVLDKLVHDQTDTLEAHMRNDPFIETAARTEWAKLCRAVPLGAGGQGMPNLFLEIRPSAPSRRSRGSTARRSRSWSGSRRKRASCPARRSRIVRSRSNSTSCRRRMRARSASRFRSNSVHRTEPAPRGAGRWQDVSRGRLRLVRHHDQTREIAASGDRLLISLLVNVQKRGLFSFFGADAAVYMWGRPVLDTQNQILRFTDVALDVQSSAAFGLLGAAAQAAAPLLQKTLAEQAVIDLKPFAADAKQRIGTAVGALAAQSPGLAANVTVDDLTARRHRLRRQDSARDRQCQRRRQRGDIVAGVAVAIRRTPECRSARGQASARECRECLRKC